MAICKADSLEKTLILRKIEVEEGNDRGWDGWMYHSINEHEFEQTPGDGEGQGSPAGSVHGVAKSQTQLSDWTTAIKWKKKKKAKKR